MNRLLVASFFLLSVAALKAEHLATNPELINRNGAPATFEADKKSFCETPYEFLCKNTNYRAEYTKLRERLKATAAENALKNSEVPDSVSRTFQTMMSHPKGQLNVAMKESDVGPYLKLVKAYLSELEKAIGIPRTEYEKDAERVRDAEIKAVQSDGSLGKEDKARMVAALRDLKILHFGDIFGEMEKLGIDWQRDLESAASMVQDYFSSCGADALHDNASIIRMDVALKYTDGTTKTEPLQLIRICPGAMLQRLISPIQGRLSWFQTIYAHELAHQMDARQMPLLYKDTIQCVATNYKNHPGLGLHRFPTDAQKREIFIQMFNEMTADSWAAKTLAKAIEEAGLAGTQEGLTAIKQAVSTYCEEQTGNKHASGEIRIGEIYGKSAPLRAIMGCPALPKEVPQCF